MEIFVSTQMLWYKIAGVCLFFCTPNFEKCNSSHQKSNCKVQQKKETRVNETVTLQGVKGSHSENSKLYTNPNISVKIPQRKSAYFVHICTHFLQIHQQLYKAHRNQVFFHIKPKSLCFGK